MSGLFARLRDNPNLEDVQPASLSFTVQGHELLARLYAFKPQKAKTYRTSEGVIFTVNGQTQASIKAPFFNRRNVGLQRLAKDLLVVIDCSSLTPREQDDVFMPSRDRVVEDNDFVKEIERRLEEELHNHQGLRALRNARARMDVEGQLADNKPMEDVLNRVLKSSPTLARIFGQGVRLQNLFKPEHVRKTEKPFRGKPHPTYFCFAGKDQGEVLERQAHRRRRVRLDFETDVENEYFTRKVDRGCKHFQRLSNGERDPVLNHVGPHLVDGKGSVTFELPDTIEVGDTVEVEFTVSDPVTDNEFSNRARVSVLPAVDYCLGTKVKIEKQAQSNNR
ncbi:MAG: hypothetical protein V6Z86_06355 [Hyphomicrobiales bacterium]